MKFRQFFKKAIPFGDGINNLLLRFGQSDPASNATIYTPQFSTLNRQRMEFMYQSSWLAGMAVDVIPEDMVREGVEFKSPDQPLVIEKLDTACDRFRIWDAICDGLKWSRLYGGAVAVIMIDGADISQPLTIDSIRKDSFRGLVVLDRWQLRNDQELNQALGESFGKPKYYSLADNSKLNTGGRPIHASRILRFEGQELPFYLQQSYQGWGASVLERIGSKIEAFDLTTQGAAQLVGKAYLRNIKIKGFRSMCGLGSKEIQDGFLNQLRLMSMIQNQNGISVIDGEDDFQTQTYTFAGLPEILLQFGQQVSGAIGIPLVRLFGQSPTGFNATGESDLRTYYDNIRHLQDTKLRANLERLWRIIAKSETGLPLSDTFSFEFKPLWQMTSEQRAQSAQQMTQTIISALDAGAISKECAVTELRKLSQTVSLFSSITDDDILKAREEDLAPPMPELGGSLEGSIQNPAPQGSAPEPKNAGIGAVVSKPPEAGR